MIQRFSQEECIIEDHLKKSMGIAILYDYVYAVLSLNKPVNVLYSVAKLKTTRTMVFVPERSHKMTQSKNDINCKILSLWSF